MGQEKATPREREAVPVRTDLRAGWLTANHSGAVAVRTSVRAGRIALNHSQVAAGR